MAWEAPGEGTDGGKGEGDGKHEQGPEGGLLDVLISRILPSIGEVAAYECFGHGGAVHTVVGA